MKNILRKSNFSFTKWCVALIAVGWMGAMANAQTTVFSESMGTPAGTTAIATYATGTAPATFQNKATLTFTGTGDVRTSGASTTYTGASGGGNVFLTSPGPKEFQIAGINTAGFSTFSISFGVSRSAATQTLSELSLEYSSDGTTYTAISIPAQTAASGWIKLTLDNLSLPATANLRLRFKNNSAVASGGQQIRLDDISLTASSGGTPPTVTGISPASGLAGTIVTVTGTGFTSVTAVNFNGIAAASFTVNSATSITATAPVGATTGPISVVTAGGTGSSSGNFTVPALAITVPSSINEGDSSQIATVTATPAPTSDLTITLTSSSATDLTVDGGTGAGATSTATIAANTTEASFFLNAPADNTIDNNASVSLTATAVSGYSSGTAIVTVRNVDFNPPTIVVNKAYNSGGANGADDVVELLVIGNGTPGSTLNLQGMILKDYSSSAASDGGGAYIFSNAPLWSSVKAGTLIVLTKPGTTPPAEDVDGADFVIKANLSNLTYFAAGTGGFDVGGTELVQIKASGSVQAGSAGVIHSFAIGTSSAAQVAAAPLPKLICFSSGNNPFAKSSTKTLADFDGIDAAQSASPLGMGIPNNADNATYIAGLRGSKDISITIDPSIAIIKEDAGLQAGKIIVALTEVTNSDLTVTLSVTPSGVATIPASVVIPIGTSSATIDFTPINDGVIAGNRTVTISGSSSGWNSGNNTATVVDIQFDAPSVVINEVVNGADAFELLVVQNNLNMVGMILKDFSTNMTGDAGRQFTFADNVLWQSVKAGTLLVLTSDAAATEDTDAADGVVTVRLTNTTYFAATGGSFDFANNDMVMIKASGSGSSGILGAIHTFGNGPAGSLFNLANGAKLLFAAGGAGGGADNATSAIVDYNGTGVTGGTATLGAANNANNQTYITALRASVNSAPTDIGLTATSIAENNVVIAIIGTLSTTDADAGDTFTYSLVAGTGDTDNSSFNISDTSLRASAAFDFETKSSYSIRVRTTDSANNTFEKAFTITVTDVVEQTAQEAYLASFGLSGVNLLGTADPDGDGMNNNAEFAFGTSPVDGSSRAVTQESVVGGIKITYLQRSGVTYTVKSATDLATGFTGTVTPLITSPQPTGLPLGYEQYEATLTGGDRGFMQVEATVP